MERASLGQNWRTPLPPAGAVGDREFINTAAHRKDRIVRWLDLSLSADPNGQTSEGAVRFAVSSVGLVAHPSGRVLWLPDGSGGVTVADRSVIHAGGGYLPSPVPVVVEIDGKKYQAVISGTSVQTPPGLTLEKRTRSYWYKEVD